MILRTSSVAGPVSGHVVQRISVNAAQVELVEAILAAAVLGVVLLAGVVQIRPQPVQREACRPAPTRSAVRAQQDFCYRAQCAQRGPSARSSQVSSGRDFWKCPQKSIARKAERAVRALCQIQCCSCKQG